MPNLIDECLRAVCREGFYLHLSVFGCEDRHFFDYTDCIAAVWNYVAKTGGSMIQIKNLTLTHKYDLRTILENFQLVLKGGDKAVIIGEEGNGKSTLLKWLYSPALVEDYVEARGERICRGERLGYLPQELPDEEKEKSVYEFFCEEELFWETDNRELLQLAGELSLPAEFFYREQKMKTLSGGEKVKAQIARSLLGKPTVLLLDEPSNDIDIETLQWLEKLIQNTRQAVLFISHDETLIENTANIVIHLEQLRRKSRSRYTVSHMGYEEYLSSRNLNFANQRRRAENDKREEQNRQEKLRRMLQKINHDLNAVSRQDPHSGYLLKKKMHTVKAMEKRFEREVKDMTGLPEEEEAIFFRFKKDIAVPDGKTVLEYHLPVLEAPDGRILARDIFLRVKGSQKVCIIGKNGAGKTTLLRKMAGELLRRTDIHAAYMPQNYEELLELDQTPVEYLTSSGDKEELTRIRTYLGSLKYTADEMEHSVRELSGGQKAKVLLLKMSLSGADVLILDEPTRNFSPLSNPVIREVLEGFGGAVLSISHDRKYIAEVCDTVYELRKEGLCKIR